LLKTRWNSVRFYAKFFDPFPPQYKIIQEADEAPSSALTNYYSTLVFKILSDCVFFYFLFHADQCPGDEKWLALLLQHDECVRRVKYTG
jgi:hypothetical protein